LSEAIVTFDVAKALAIRKNKIKGAQAALDTQVLKDSNYFCPQAEGDLIKSSIAQSRIGEGLLIWATPYAHAQYYGLPKKSLDVNPNARMKWFEEAKVRHLEDWRALTKGTIRG
jgi:hypothetical protein